MPSIGDLIAITLALLFTTLCWWALLVIYKRRPSPPSRHMQLPDPSTPIVEVPPEASPALPTPDRDEPPDPPPVAA